MSTNATETTRIITSARCGGQYSRWEGFYTIETCRTADGITRVHTDTVSVGRFANRAKALAAAEAAANATGIAR